MTKTGASTYAFLGFGTFDIRIRFSFLLGREGRLKKYQNKNVKITKMAFP
jgi:hypothetical protein